jgi:uncharacterized damage-inducible protein DinB
MKAILQQYCAYNTWANQTLFDAIQALPTEQQTAEVPSSFPSLLKTVLHMWDAEYIWWQRVKLQERIVRPSDQFNGSFAEAAQEALRQNRQWEQWINNAQDRVLEHVFQYQNSRKESFKQPIYEMLLHLFNHGTYHRGQLVTMMRALGVEKIPPTDFIVWSRKK